MDFDKLFLVKDGEYGTHVTYICCYPHFVIDFFSNYERLEDIIEEIKFYIVLEEKKTRLGN